jgi:RNA polymerase sigma-70 factor (ECF subfamily)
LASERTLTGERRQPERAACEDEPVNPELVMRAQGGDERAFADVAYAIADRLFTVAHRILRDVDLAEDATQQAIVVIWRELPGLRDPARFEAWSYRVLVNACYAQARAERRWSPSLRVLETDHGGGDPELTVADRDELERGFRRLPPEQRAVLVFQHYLDMTLPQIAELLGVPIGTVRSRLHYARRAMRAALEADARPALTGSRPS